jgi:multiple sugar transport system permease protein
MEIRPRTMSMSQSKLTGAITWYVIASLIVFLFFFPYFWTITSSLKETWELVDYPPTIFPRVPQWGNYARVFEKVPFLTWTSNTIYIVTLSTVGGLLTASMAGYAFARGQFRGKGPIFLISLGTMMLPAQVTLIPQFVLFHQLGWLNSFRPLWVPSWFGGGAFAIFLMRQFIMSLPQELDESAIIDGASYFRIFWSILMPLCKPALATLGVISIIGNWNEFLTALIYLNSENKLTIAVGLNYFKNVPEVGGAPMQHLLMAASVMSTAPLIILFFLAQSYFVQGVVMTGIKG